jgi:hypothetical protein
MSIYKKVTTTIMNSAITIIAPLTKLQRCYTITKLTSDDFSERFLANPTISQNEKINFFRQSQAYTNLQFKSVYK